MKRGMDIVIALIGLAVMAIPMMLLSFLIALKLGRPVMFRQIRPGLNAKPFQMIKFRTMTDERDDGGNLLPDEIRLTSFGKFLRSTSLDELPELWNVLKGEMSIVGPRPLLIEYLEHYDEVQMRRHEVRPGITGWAQVNGRNAISWSDKFALDVWYVDNQSLFLDLRILFLTIQKVIKRDGISAEGDVTMPKFTGNHS